jgi:hypothetical protein
MAFFVLIAGMERINSIVIRWSALLQFEFEVLVQKYEDLNFTHEIYQKPLNPTKNPFRWKHYEGEIILLNVRWYCSYGLSYRNLVEMMGKEVLIYRIPPL